MTLEGVAASAGVARTTVYRRWSSKEDLIASAIAMERGSPEREVTPGSELSAATRDGLISRVADTLATPNYRSMVARLIGSVPDHPELMATYWETYLAPRREQMHAFVERARNAGLVRSDLNIEIVLDLMSGAIMHQLLVRNPKISAAKLRDYLHEVSQALGLEDDAQLSADRSPESRDTPEKRHGFDQTE